MSPRRGTYLDSSAIVKLVRSEPETVALRTFLRRRTPLVSSALALTEVARAVLPFGADAVQRAELVLERVELVRVSDLVLRAAARLAPEALGSLDAIHVASALDLGDDLARLVTYDDRMALAATGAGLQVHAPA